MERNIIGYLLLEISACLCLKNNLNFQGFDFLVQWRKANSSEVPEEAIGSPLVV
jgi:hypothetical protein